MTLLYKPSKVKRILAFAGLALSLLLSASCKKSNSGGGNNSGYYIKFKLSGVQKNFQYPGTAITTKSGSYYTLALAAATATNATDGEAMGIDLFSSKPIAVNTQYAMDLTSGNLLTEVVMSYANDTKAWVSSIDVPANQLVKVTITQMTSTQIKGTFSGGLTDEDDPTKVVYTVTDGEFNLKLSQE